LGKADGEVKTFSLAFMSISLSGSVLEPGPGLQVWCRLLLVEAMNTL
jgi:hypothetical protein